MDAPRLSRRDLLIRSAALLGGGAALACNKKPAAFTCMDTGGLPEAALEARKNAAYVDHAADPARACKGCSQFMGSYDGCGACKLIRGPVHPEGTCKVFAPKG